MDAARRKPIQESKERIEELEKQIKDFFNNPEKNTDNPNACYNKKKIVDSGSVLSHEATKMCLLFIDSLPDENTVCLLTKKLDQAVLSLAAAYFNMPHNIGKHLSSSVQKNVVKILRSLRDFLGAALQCDGRDNSKRLAVGVIREACESLASLPANNVEAFLVILCTQSELVQDALDEMRDSITEEVVDDEMANFDREMASKCIGLIKAARSCLKRTSSVLNNKLNAEVNPQLSQDVDKLGTYLEDISRLVDDFASALYPPTRESIVLGNAHNLASAILECVKKTNFAELYCDEDSAWIDFLKEAVEHNLNIIAELTGN